METRNQLLNQTWTVVTEFAYNFNWQSFELLCMYLALARRATMKVNNNYALIFFFLLFLGVPALLRPEFGPALQVPQYTPQFPPYHPCTRLATQVAAPLPHCTAHSLILVL